jgi:hypothetical protein
MEGTAVQPQTGRRRAAGLLSVGVALVVLALGASSAQAAELNASVPDTITTGFFDDHSISGDNHAGWGPTEEPLAVRFRAAVGNTGPAISMCGTIVSAGWAAARSGSCDGPQFGWFRYITANHFGHNRWQLYDFQRFALVRVGGPEVIWDTRWGSCVNASPFSDCSRDPNVVGPMGLLPDAVKVTQDGADEDQIIAIPNQLGYRLPEGAWQLIHIVNPYGNIPGDTAAGNVACARLTLTWDPAPGGSASPLQLAAREGAEACQLPPASAYPPPITGPGDPTDPMRFAQAFPITCAPTATGHCWTTAPTRCSPASPTARTFTSGTLVPATDPCAPGAGSGAGGSNPVRGLSERARNLRITASLSRRYASQALRKALKLRRTPRGVRRSCRVTSRVAARCTVTYRTSTQRVSGRIWLRFVAGATANRWTYRVDLRSTRNGRTTRIRHGYRTGGRLAS